MINLTANPNEGADLHRLHVCLNSLTPPDRNACKAVGSVDGFQRVQNVSSIPGSAPKNALVSLRSNVHQNVHQRIETDRVGYVRIRLDLCCKCLQISILHSDSNPPPRIKAGTIGYRWIIPD
jgi:hypothetical protein